MRNMDEEEHIDSLYCWCHPDLLLEGVKGMFGDVWVHKGFGEELPPPFIIAWAIADAFIEEEIQ